MESGLNSRGQTRIDH